MLETSMCHVQNGSNEGLIGGWDGYDGYWCCGWNADLQRWLAGSVCPGRNGFALKPKMLWEWTSGEFSEDNSSITFYAFCDCRVSGSDSLFLRRCLVFPWTGETASALESTTGLSCHHPAESWTLGLPLGFSG